MTQEIGLTLNPAAGALGTLYAVPRSLATGAKPWKVTPLAFDLQSYADASAKVALGEISGRGVSFTTAEIRAYYTGIAAMQTFVRHGGKVPWVPDRWADVKSARKVQGAAPDALPDPSKGTILLDPFGFVPGAFDARQRVLVRGARDVLHAMQRAYPNDKRPAGFYVENVPVIPIPSPGNGGTDTLAAFPVGVAIAGILVAGAVIGWGIYEWADASKHDSDNRWSVTQEYAEYMGEIEKGLAAESDRIAAEKQTGKPIEPGPIEKALADKIKSRQSKPETDRWVGPLVALASAGVIFGGLYYVSKEREGS